MASFDETTENVRAGFIIRPLFEEKDFVAEVVNADLNALTDDEIYEINQAILKYKVLVFRDQNKLSVEDQRRFGQRFGVLHSHIDKRSHHPQFSDVNVISNISNSPKISPVGSDVTYHSDLSWCDMPSKLTMLRTVVTPTFGGETYFSDTTTAYDRLPAGWKVRLEGLTGFYTWLKWVPSVPGIEGSEHERMVKGVHHPIISTHPETGRKNIFGNLGHMTAVDGVSAEESQSIQEFLYAYVASPEFEYAHYYRDGDAVFWDNRSVQHRATREPSGARQLIRITVQNDEAPLAEIDTLRVFAPRQPVPTLASPAATSTTTAADVADVADKAAVTA